MTSGEAVRDLHAEFVSDGTEAAPGGRTAVLRSDVFEGGCLAERYLPAAGRPGPPVDEAALAADLTTREALGQALHSRSGGRLRLDPTREQR